MIKSAVINFEKGVETIRIKMIDWRILKKVKNSFNDETSYLGISS